MAVCSGSVEWSDNYKRNVKYTDSSGADKTGDDVLWTDDSATITIDVDSWIRQD
jgi:hypothetical protein